MSSNLSCDVSYEINTMNDYSEEHSATSDQQTVRTVSKSHIRATRRGQVQSLKHKNFGLFRVRGSGIV